MLKKCFHLLIILQFSFYSLGIAEPITTLIPGSSYFIPNPESKDQLPETDFLISLSDPKNSEAIDLDMPQIFATIHYPPNSQDNMSERKDLLGDLEEIKFQDKRAWGANVAFDKEGLYQFIIEGKPFWDEEKQIFHQQQAKVYVPVSSDGIDWSLTGIQSFEIIPLTRPFGLSSPCIFNGKVIFDNKPLANAHIFMGQMNTGKKANLSPWHNVMNAKSDPGGQFSFILDQPGWWYCEAITSGEPLKGPDGEMKPTELAAIIWIYVDNRNK